MTTRSAQLLRLVHARPGITRAEAARLLGVSTGAATELVGRLTAAEVLTEGPAAPSGARGRPTTVLLPHPAGPLVAAASITSENFQVDVVELGGTVVGSVSANHGDRDPAPVLAAVTDAIRALTPENTRLRGVGIAITGPVSRDQRVDSSGLGWHGVDLRPLKGEADVFVAGNDAMLAAAAESGRGAAAEASIALHVRVAAGIGGGIIAGGRIVTGALGAAGEFGHLPFGDPRRRCSCGASGCWGNEVDGTALARLLGRPAPPDPIAYARRVIASDDADARAATRTVAAELGRGIAGLVNGLDPDLVTVGGLGVELLEAAPDAVQNAYRDGLMTFRRGSAPPVVAAALGDDGPIVGAAEEAWGLVLDEVVSRLRGPA
ncbi:ROK family transcriptional regulator [Cryptosporangium phraense]|uniref:ROK family protein n=1 Tax=Cryptosporangium phraense TaxID=2593070 RepID=A0A545AEA5_9ACTN|nr:ROK family transcriptional regulator [Cryptosporangium phraense]TQS39652.1 ROK family protein [Cryptosporangium phraense]